MTILQAASNAAVSSMCTLNNKPLHVLQQLPGVVHAATDVTGFGLLGHLRGITKGSNVDCEIDSSAVPLLTDALKLASIPGMQKGGIRFFFFKIIDQFFQSLFLVAPRTISHMFLHTSRLIRLLQNLCDTCLQMLRLQVAYFLL